MSTPASLLLRSCEVTSVTFSYIAILIRQEHWISRSPLFSDVESIYNVFRGPPYELRKAYTDIYLYTLYYFLLSVSFRSGSILRRAGGLNDFLCGSAQPRRACFRSTFYRMCRTWLESGHTSWSTVLIEEE